VIRNVDTSLDKNMQCPLNDPLSFPIDFVLIQRNFGEIANLFKIGIYLSKLPPYQELINRCRTSYAESPFLLW
jgi:hypothetical protein